MKRLITALLILAAIPAWASYKPRVDSVVSTLNSTTSTLGDGNSWTGTAEVVTGYSALTVMCDSDVPGTLYLDLSIDGTNWDRTKQIPTSGSVHTLMIVSEYFRARYTDDNDSSAQTHFRLETMYHAEGNFLASSPNQVIGKSTDARVVRVANDPAIDMSRSLFNDKQVVHKFGIADETGAGDDIWANNTAVATYPWPTSAQNVVVVSASANDTSAGSGARTVLVEGLDTNWAQATETLTMSGATSVTGATAFVRVNRLYVDDCGTYGSANAGAITLTHETSGNTLAIIEADAGQSRQTMYSVPASYTAYIRRMDVTVQAGGTDDATVSAYRRPAADDTSAPMKAPRIFHTFSNLEGDAESEWFAMQSFAEKTDIWLTADAVSGTPDISATYDLILIKNDNPTAPQ